MKIKNFLEKGEIGKIFTESEIFSEIGRKSETGGMHHCLKGMDAPGEIAWQFLKQRCHLCDKLNWQPSFSGCRHAFSLLCSP